MAGRADITLTLATRLEGVDAEAQRLHDEMARAGGAAGRDAGANFGGEFTKGLLAQEPKIARAYEKTVTSISRTAEVREKLNRAVEQSTLTHQREADALEKLNRLKESGTATTKELSDAEDALAVAVDDNTSAMNRRITLQNQLVRLNRDHASALRLVVKAQDEVAAESSAGQSLLSAGKFISALRAVAIPAVGLLAGSFGANILAVTAAAAQGLWMIPAAAGAAGAAIGTLSVATLGFSDTIKEMGDPEKFAEAIQNLSPNAQQAALSIQALMEPLTALKNSVQDALFADFGPMINELANQYMPAIEGMMTGIAGAFNTAAKSVFDQLMNPATQQVITNTINSLVTAFERLAPAAGPFVDAILKIIETGASYLPQIADAATNAAREFSAFITNAQESGDLSRWFQEGLNTIDQLWEMVKNLGVAFMNLAPIGREHLPQINEILKNIAYTIPPIVDALAGMITPFAMIAEAANKMWGVTGGILERMGTSAGAVGRAIDGITNAIKGLIDMIPGLGPGLRVLETFNRLIPGGPSNGTPNAFIVPSSGAGSIFGGGGPFDATASAPTGLLGAGGAGDFGGGVPRPSVAVPVGPLSTVDVGGGGLLGGGAGMSASPGTVGGPGLGILPGQPTAGLPGYPMGGYPVPPPPAPKGSGGGAKADEPPFTADPSLYSVDAIPVTPISALPNGLSSPSGLTPNAQNLNNIMSALFPMLPAAGGWREPDGFNEHSKGEAVDFMTGGNFALGDSMNQFMLQQAEALGLQYTIWKQMQWFPDGRVTPMQDRGDPTQNHMDHVHARVLPGQAKAGGIAIPGQNAGAGAQAMMGGYQVDPEAVLRAEMAMQTARENVEEKRLRLLELEAKGNASQRELMAARNDVRQAEDNYRLKELDLAQARQGKYKEMDGKLKGAAQGLGEIGAALADDFGLSEGLPGVAKWLTTFLANLAFAPMMGALSAVSAASPIQGGHGMLGIMGAQNVAAGGSPLGLSNPGMTAAPAAGFSMGAPMSPIGLPAYSAVGPMATAAPMGLGVPLPGPALPAEAAMGPAPLGGGIGSGAGMPGLAGPPASMPTQQTSAAPRAASPGGGFQGIGGLPLEAAMTATAGLDLLAPGASQAAQMGIKLANRTAGYIGQLGAIGVGGLMETFLPNNSSVADPSKSWLGKIAAGVAGARPAMPNSAGSPAPAQPAAAGQQQAGQGGGPLVKIDNIVNNTADSGQTLSSQIARMSMSGYASRGGR